MSGEFNYLTLEILKSLTKETLRSKLINWVIDTPLAIQNRISYGTRIELMFIYWPVAKGNCLGFFASTCTTANKVRTRSCQNMDKKKKIRKRSRFRSFHLQARYWPLDITVWQVLVRIQSNFSGYLGFIIGLVNIIMTKTEQRKLKND